MATKQSISSQTIKMYIQLVLYNDLELFICTKDYSLLEARCIIAKSSLKLHEAQGRLAFGQQIAGKTWHQFGVSPR